jgi:hypothetical protein
LLLVAATAGLIGFFNVNTTSLRSNHPARARESDQRRARR